MKLPWYALLYTSYAPQFSVAHEEVFRNGFTFLEGGPRDYIGVFP